MGVCLGVNDVETTSHGNDAFVAVNWFGNGDEEKWYLCFPIMGAITLLSALWLLVTPIEREERQPSSSIGGTLSLLGDKTILLLFFGIFFAVGTDVSTNFISSKVMISPIDYLNFNEDC
jgi:hypothetical protein